MSSRVETWDALAPDYDGRRVHDHVYMACQSLTISKAGHMDKTAHVLEAGCGTGIGTVLLARRVSNLTAIDYSDESLAMLRESLGRTSKRVRLRRADIRNLPFPDESFDHVICANTLQHLEPRADQPEAVRELLRVLKPGGSFSFSMHHYSREKEAAGWIKEGEPGEPGIDYIYRYSVADVRTLLPDAHIVASGFYGLPALGSMGIATKIQELATTVAGGRLARRRLGHMLIAYGSKRMTRRPRWLPRRMWQQYPLH